MTWDFEKIDKIIKEADIFYPRIVRRDENEYRHKLAPVAARPCPVLKVKRKTVIISWED